jgi:predicted dehydrogenase
MAVEFKATTTAPLWKERTIMKEIGVGVIGCGFVGRGAHVPSFAEIDGVRLVAVADADPKRRNKAATKHQVEASYDDYQKLVQDPQIDVVIVALPTPLHVPASLAALEAGKHVICEMPLATSLDEADRLVDAANNASVVLMPSLTFRFTPNYVKAKEMIVQGALGNPTGVLYREFIPASDLASQWPADCWMWQMEKSGGPLFTLSVWSIDLIRWLFDTEISSVDAAVKYTRLEKTGGTLGYDAYVTVRLANGMVGCLQYSGSVNHAAAKSNLEVIGDSTCMLSATDNDRVTLFGESPEKTIWNVKESGPKLWGHQQQNEYFVRCIQEGREPDIKPEDGRRAMEIARKIAQATSD